MHLRLSRISRDEGGPSAGALRRLSTELGRRHGSGRRARGAGFTASVSPLQQRSLVKVSYARNKGRGAWRAQGRYLTRAGAQQARERGLGFDAERFDVDLPARLASWQEAGDGRLWKIVVSPEAGARVDLRAHARELMTQIENDLGTRLEWAAIDHHDTAHPHVHIVVRGIDDTGQALLLSRDYVRSGIRARSQELLTRALGHRHERDQRLARENAVEAPRVTEIDRSLLARADAHGGVSFEDAVPTHPAAQERRLQDLRRLHYLEGLGLAEQRGGKRWILSPELLPALRQIQLAGDVQKSLARSPGLVADRDAPIVLTRMTAGIEVTGRVAGGGIDESRDEPLLIVEGTDGQRHLIPQTAEIHAARGEGRLRPGSIVTLRGAALAPTGSRAATIRPIEHGTLRDLKRTETASTVLDRDALRSVRETGALPPPVADRRGFFRQWRAAVRARIPVLEREGLLRRSRDITSQRTFEVGKGAERMVEGRIARGAAMPVTLRDLERMHGKPARSAEAAPERVYRGHVAGYAIEDDGERYVVLDTGQELTAIPTTRRDLELGHAARARAVASVENDHRERRSLTWALDDLEHERDRGRGR